MAEAFPEEEGSFDQEMKSEMSFEGTETHVSGAESAITVLFLVTKWQFDTCGLSTVNRSLVNNLRFVDPDGRKIKITCGILEEEETIKNKNDQRNDAEKLKVKLRGAKQPRGPKEKPDIKWLDRSTAAYYGHVMKENVFDYIVGHSPYLANGCLNFKDNYPEGSKPRVILIANGLPKTPKGRVDEDLLKEWLIEADYIFSVGKAIHAEMAPYITSLEPDERPEHKMYIPGFPLELFDIRKCIESTEVKKLQVTQNVTLPSGEAQDFSVSGLDFPLAVAATTQASKYILEDDGVQTNLLMLVARKEDVGPWEERFLEVLEQKNITLDSLKFQCVAIEDYKTLESHLRKSNLFLFPSTYDSPIFGTESLAAIAAGVPVLVSVYSGMGFLFRSMFEDDSVVKTTEIETWRQRMLEKLLSPVKAQQVAERLRGELLLDTKIAYSHLDFIRAVAGEQQFTKLVSLCF